MCKVADLKVQRKEKNATMNIAKHNNLDYNDLWCYNQ